MRERLLTPSKITAWLDCAHYLTLKHEVESGVRDKPPSMFGEMAQMLVDKGLTHEQEVLARYAQKGRPVHTVPERCDDESFARWVDRVGDVLPEGHDVIFQMPFVHDGIQGVADFLERVDLADGSFTYEPVDAKLARKAAKSGHVLQLCFYAEAITTTTGHAPEQLHIELGSGRRETIRVADVSAYWRRLRGQLARVVNEPAGETKPDKCDHCPFCEFEQVCDAEWREADSLIHVAGVHTAHREILEADGVATIASLATLDRPVDELDPERLKRFIRQASLQVEAREAPEDDPPPFELLVAADDPDQPLEPSELRGFAALPRPDDGDVFLDFEGHPFWRADTELFFLFGLIEFDDGDWRFKAFWAHDETEEAQAVADLIAYLSERRKRHPGMHVYHYNHTERSALVRLTEHHGVAELELERQIATGMFVDLFPVVMGAMQVGVESYGLKHIERLTDYERGHDIDRGAGAVVEYERFMADGEQQRLDRIARYNEDDVRATRAVRDWLVDHRPADLASRPAVTEPKADDRELDDRIERLHEFEPGTPEHLMGDLLGYWRRERSVVAADCLRLSMAPEPDQLEAFGSIGQLKLAGVSERFGKSGKKLTADEALFTFPPQNISPDIEAGSKLIQAINEQEWGFFTVLDIDVDAGELRIEWHPDQVEAGWVPTSLVHYVWYDEGHKLTALCALADQMLAGEDDRVGHRILRREAPRFTAGHGPAEQQFDPDYTKICRWAPHLDGSYVPVQGPPGTGKTFTGAHVVRTLQQLGKRVGITAMSHAAIDNLMEAVIDLYKQQGDLSTLRAVRRGGAGIDGVDPAWNNGQCVGYDVIGGTPWLFASPDMCDDPVDVLVVDEAGQLGLADTLAATVSAKNVILLGDPQQLPQVAQASHPNRSGVSALEHLLGEGTRTFPPERGVLLDVTRRMHPDVCGFISDVMYDGKLTSHGSCGGQTTVEGTGLRWIQAEHAGNATESAEEAELVAQIVRPLMGTDWIDQHGATSPISIGDVIVVTPYNDQRRLIEATLNSDSTTAGIEVGTVDKFQGREAAVVVFSMATSSAEFMPRQADFLFSKNRLNVAISRARCLAYLICTDELLNTRARDVEEMELIGALCSLVERARRTSS
ncbi:TM0106 family RecB-like putative nuclease [Ilumatobacter fluminis]|nr:TM0106 family RecB-like putative nuclease [Ilumatobacter fluminis]